MADDFEFRAFMLQVSQRMTSNDFGQLKYLLKGYVSNAKCEEIKAVCDYFEELHRMCLLSPTNFGVLKTALGFIGRQDLVEDIEEKEQYFANLFRDKKEDSLEPKEYEAVCDGITEAAGKLKPYPRSGQNAAELQKKLQLTSLENEDKEQLEEISDILGITELRKENKEVKKGNDLVLKKDEWSMQSNSVEMRAGGGDEQEEVKPTLHMDNAESMEIPIEDTVQCNSSESAMEAEDHQLESKTTEQALASVEKITLSTQNEKEPVEDTVPDCDELEDLNTAKDQNKYTMTEATTGTTNSPPLGDDVVTDGKENDKGITADSKKDEIKTTSNGAQNQGPQHPHGPGARPKEPLSKKAKTADASGADKQMGTEQADEAKHQGPQHLHGPGTRPKEPLSKKAKTLDVSGADKQVATEQADEVSETTPYGTLFVGPLHPKKTGSKEPTEDDHLEPLNPTGEIFSCDGNESDDLYSAHDDLYSAHEDESTESEQSKTPMHGPGQGASATASKGPHLCNHPPGIFSTPPDQNTFGYIGHPSAGNYSFPELIVGESTMDGQGQGACATASKQPIGCHPPPGVFFSNPANQKASGYSDHAVPGNFSLLELMQIASAIGLNIEASNQLELLEKLQALQTSVGYAQGSSTYNAAEADSPLRSNCYSQAGYSVVITNGHLYENTSGKGVFMMESGTQFCILIANNNNYAAEVDITFGGMWLGAWVVEAKQSLSTPLVIEGSSWTQGRLKFFSPSDARKPPPSADQPAPNGVIELEFKPECKMLKVHAKHVKGDELFEISIIETKTTTVGDLKQEIRKKWNSGISCLLKGGEVLQEEKTISSYALNENEVIGVLNAEEELVIESLGMDPVTMMVDPRNVSLVAVKHFIEKKIGIPVDKQILRFTEQDTTVDSESLDQMFLKSEQSPVLKVDKDRIINIMVSDGEGKENKVEINWSATVDDLKEKLKERAICDTSAKLRFDDQEISGKGGKKLVDLGFKNKSKIIASQTKRSTLRGFSGSTFVGGSNLRGFGGFRGCDGFSSSPSALRGFPKGTRTFRSGPEDAEDNSSEYHGKEGFAVLHGTEKSVLEDFKIDDSGQKFAKEKAVTLVIQLIAKSVGAAGAAAAASSQSSVPPEAYYSGGPTGPMSTPTPPPVPD